MSRRRARFSLLLALTIALTVAASLAGGPRILNVSGTPLRWPTSSSVPYQVDAGTLGTLANDQATALVQEAFSTLSSVPGTSLQFQMTAKLTVDVTEQNWAHFFGVAGDGRSPVIFDTDGRILDQLLGLTARSDFEGATRLELSSGTEILEASILINGACFDGVSDARSPCELRGLEELRALLLHEAGHFCNLDHSDLNRQFADDGDPSNNAVLPTMYPLHSEDDSTLSILNLDDRLALISLYPRLPSDPATGGIEGLIRTQTSSGPEPVSGANVVVRDLGDPFFLAASTVSGTTGGAGFYRFSRLPPGNYTVEVAPVASAFVGRSSVGQHALSGVVVRLPGPREYLDGSESFDGGGDDPDTVSLQVVQAGATLTGRDILLNSLAGLANDQAGGSNNNCATARRIPERGDALGDRIVAGDVDFYKIAVPAGWKLRVDLDSADPNMDSSLQGALGLFRQVGPVCQNVTSSAVAIPDPGSGEAITDPAYEYVPSSEGDVIVAVTSVGDTAFTGSSGLTTGPYYLRVTPLPPAVTSLEQVGSGGGTAIGGAGASIIVLVGGFPGAQGPEPSTQGGSISAASSPVTPLPDADGDGLPDLIDPCPTSPDTDADGVCDRMDNCVAAANAGQADGDDDGSGDSCDAPAVRAVAPPDNSFTVPLAASVQISFSEPMDPASFGAPGDPTAISLRGPGGAPVAVSRSISPDGMTVTLDPLASLGPGTAYSVNMGTLLDRDTPPRSLSSFSSTFKTIGTTSRPALAADRIGQDVEGSSSAGLAGGDSHGAALASSGDVNSDGFSDILIGEPVAQGGASSSGRVLLRFGARGVVGGASSSTIELAGAESSDEAGRSVAFLGDVNGDQIGDLLVGAPGASPLGSAAPGAAYLVFGKSDWSSVSSPVDLSTIGTPPCNSTRACGIVLVGDTAGDRAGATVSPAGDINHDGRLDILVGAPNRTVMTSPLDLRTGAGSVYLVFGGASLQSQGTIQLSAVASSVPGVVYLGENSGDAAGAALSEWRDRTMDGVDDLLIAGPGADVLDPNGAVLADAGTVYSVRGVTGMTSGVTDLRNLGQTVAGAVLLGVTVDAKAGTSLSGHRDVTGDGEFDALIGAPGMSFAGRSNVGSGVLVPSLSSGLSVPLKGRGTGTFCLGSPLPGTPPPFPPPAAPRSLAGCLAAASDLEATLFMGEATGDAAATEITGAGDLNGDDVEEILLGAPGADVADPNGPISDAGRVYVILGQAFRATGPVPLDDVGTSVPGIVIEGRTAAGRLGEALAGGGDVDGTLTAEILVGAPGDPAAPPDSGRVYITAPFVAGIPGDLTVTGGASATLEWSRAAGAIRHRAYRGSLSSLGADGGVRTSSAICLTPGAAPDTDADMDGRPDVVDTAVPSAGDGFWYLVTGVNFLGEGSPGTDSTGRLRRNDGPCP